MGHPVRPVEELEVERRLAEPGEAHRRRRVRENLVAAPGRLEQSPLDLPRVGGVGDTDRQGAPELRSVEAVVDDGGLGELRVGHDDVDVVVGAQHRRARTDLDDLRHQVFDFDSVAHAKGPLDQQDQPGDEILDDVLEPEPDAHAQGGAERRERRGVDAQGLQRDGDAEKEDEVTGEPAEDQAQARGDLRPREETVRDEPPDEARQQIRRDEDDEADREAEDGDVRLADLKQLIVQNFSHDDWECRIGAGRGAC